MGIIAAIEKFLNRSDFSSSAPEPKPADHSLPSKDEEPEESPELDKKEMQQGFEKLGETVDRLERELSQEKNGINPDNQKIAELEEALWAVTELRAAMKKAINDEL